MNAEQSRAKRRDTKRNQRRHGMRGNGGKRLVAIQETQLKRANQARNERLQSQPSQTSSPKDDQSGFFIQPSSTAQMIQ